MNHLPHISKSFYHTISIFDPLSVHTFFFFFNDPAPPEIYPLSLHDALPISFERCGVSGWSRPGEDESRRPAASEASFSPDRKSTRLNSSHSQISYAVFCLKKKNARTWRELLCEVRVALDR